MGLDAATAEIYVRLTKGFLHAAGSVGETMEFHGPSDRRSVVPELWWAFEPTLASPTHRFWRTATVILTVPNAASNGAHRTSYTHVGVRFEPEGLQRIADDSGIQVAISTNARIARALLAQPGNVPQNVPLPLPAIVSASEFDTWFAAQAPDVQAWGGAKLREKCSLDHGGRHVLKKATDHITKGRKTGRKPGSKTSRPS
jgi:hypothetical protein